MGSRGKQAALAKLHPLFIHLLTIVSISKMKNISKRLHHHCITFETSINNGRIDKTVKGNKKNNQSVQLIGRVCRIGTRARPQVLSWHNLGGNFLIPFPQKVGVMLLLKLLPFFISGLHL